MKPAAKRLYGILASFGLFVAALVVYSALLIPQYKEIQELRGQTISLANFLEQEEAAVTAISKLLKENEISELQTKVGTLLPTEEETASIVNQFQGIAVSNNVLMKSLSLNPLAPTNREENSITRPTGVVRVNVSILGSYADLKKYLDGIETNVRVMDVQSLQIVNAGKNSGPYEFDLEVDTYYQI